MAVYTYRVKIDGTDVTDAVIAPLTWTNGRNTLRDTLGKTFGQASLYKDKLQEIYGFTPLDVVTFGQELLVEVYDTAGGGTWTTATRGKITDISSDRETISVAFVDAAIWTITRIAELSLPTGNQTDVSAKIVDVVDAYITATDQTTGGPYEVHWTIQDTTNLGDWVSTVVADIPSGFAYFNDQLVIVDREATPTAGITITPAMVFDSYNISRGIADICNSVKVNYHNGGNYSETNATSVTAIGTRHVDVTSYLKNLADAEVLARTFLGRFAPEGWPIVAFRTTADMLGKSGKWIADNMLPNLVFDASAIADVPFASLMYLEQATHELGPNQWGLQLVVSNAAYSNLPQAWEDVTATVKWSDVSATITWSDMIYQDL